MAEFSVHYYDASEPMATLPVTHQGLCNYLSMHNWVGLLWNNVIYGESRGRVNDKMLKYFKVKF